MSAALKLPNPPSIEQIAVAVCQRYGVTMIDLISRRQSQAVVRPRHMAMYLARHLTTASLPAIGRWFGDRDHTTVMNAVERIDSLRGICPSVDNELTALRCDLEPRT